MQRILSTMRQAIEQYNMIEEGDKIAVCLSGGKDSITLLLALKNLQIFYPKHFEIIAITIDPGFEFFDVKFLKDLCKEQGVDLFVGESHAKEIVFDIRDEKNPCSLCANLRRGIINSIAIENGCNKIALGHNKEDVLETFFLNLLYTGNIHTFSPVSYMDRSKVTLIRPLIYTEEKEIKRALKKLGITPMAKTCPMDGYSKREDMKNLINDFSKEIPQIKANLMGAIERAKIDGWKERK